MSSEIKIKEAEYINKTYTKLLKALSCVDGYVYIGGLPILIYSDFNLNRKLNDLDIACKANKLKDVEKMLHNLKFIKTVIPNEPKGTHITFIDKNYKYKIHVVINSLKICDAKLQRIEFEYPLIDAIELPVIKKIKLKIENICCEILCKLPPPEDCVIMKLLPYYTNKNLKHLVDLYILLKYTKINEEKLLNKLNYNEKILERIHSNINIISEKLPKDMEWFIKLLNKAIKR